MKILLYFLLFYDNPNEATFTYSDRERLGIGASHSNAIKLDKGTIEQEKYSWIILDKIKCHQFEAIVSEPLIFIGERNRLRIIHSLRPEASTMIFIRQFSPYLEENNSEIDRAISSISFF